MLEPLHFCARGRLRLAREATETWRIGAGGAVTRFQSTGERQFLNMETKVMIALMTSSRSE